MITLTRRTITGAVLAAPLLSSRANAVTWPGPNATTADWPQYCGYSDHQAFAQAERQLTAANLPNVRLLWSRPTTPGHYFMAPPIAVGPRVYVAGAKLSALDAATGDARWTRSLGQSGQCSPAYAHGIVVVVAESPKPRLMAVNAATGAVLWNVSIPKLPWCSPSIAGATVYTVCGSTVLAFSLDRGKQLWSRKIPNDAAGTHSSPTIRRGRLFVGTGGNALVTAVNAATGALLWRRRLHPSNLYGTDLGPVGTDTAGRVFAATSVGTVFALSQATGATLWQHTNPDSPQYESVAVAPTAVTATSYQSAAAINPATGALLWNRACDNGGFTIAAAAGLIYRTSSGPESQVLEVFDAATGAAIRRFPIPGALELRGASISRGRIFVSDLSGQISTFALPG